MKESIGRVSAKESVEKLPDEGGRRQGNRHQEKLDLGESAMMMLPDELVFDILFRLRRGKELIHCKSVCKHWRSIIRSPRFLKLLRYHECQLTLFPAYASASPAMDRYVFSTIVRLKKESGKGEDFSYLCKLMTDSRTKYGGTLTQVVNGLVCLFDAFKSRLNIYNVFTGEGMRLADPAHHVRCSPFLSAHYVCCSPLLSAWSDAYFPVTGSFHLGYVPTTRMYKLLRIIPPDDDDWRMGTQVEIMTLMPSSSPSPSTWRKLKIGHDLDIFASSFTYILPLPSALTVDGFLWFYKISSLISFDFNKEKFNLIKLPQVVIHEVKQTDCVTLIQSMGRLAIWVRNFRRNLRQFTLFVLENVESNLWEKHCVQFPAEPWGVAYAGNLPTGEILLLGWLPYAKVIWLIEELEEENYQEYHKHAYSFNHYTSKFERFLVGELQQDTTVVADSSSSNVYSKSSHASISILHDSSSLYLPLDDVLSDGVI